MYKTCWFNTFIYCKMITTIALANTSILSHNYNCFTVVRTIKILFFAVSQTFWHVALPFSFVLRYFLIPLISSLTHSLFRNMFNFHIFVNYQFLPVTGFWLHTIVVRKDTHDFNLLKFTKTCVEMLSFTLSQYMFCVCLCVLEKNNILWPNVPPHSSVSFYWIEACFRFISSLIPVNNYHCWKWVWSPSTIIG